jgi:hypothetical protein
MGGDVAPVRSTIVPRWLRSTHAGGFNVPRALAQDGSS